MRAEATALVSSEERTFGAVVVGVEPDREQAVSSLPGTVRAGRYLSAGDTSAAVVETRWRATCRCVSATS